MSARAEDDGGLRGLFHKNIPGHWTAVETGVVSLGVPDSNYCVGGVEGWVEFKKSESDGVIRVRPMQSAWLFRRWRAGGRCQVAIRMTHGGGKRKGPPCDHLYICDGQYAPDLITRGLRSVPSTIWVGGPERWEWEEIAARLTMPRI